MGSFGNLAISQALPQMGAIYDSYTVQAIPADLQSTKVSEDGKEVPLVVEGERSWVPEAIARHIYPAGSRKLNPEAVNVLERRAKEGDSTAQQKEQVVQNAEKNGAAWAFRWVAVLPCVLVVIFGLIAISDRLRGGYKAVHITGGRAGPDGAPGHAPAGLPAGGGFRT
jgi:hypothetical protein